MTTGILAAITAVLTFKPTALFTKEAGVFVRACTNLPSPSVARQLLPATIRITGAVEAFHTDAIDFPSFWDAGVLRPVIVSESNAIDIDTKADLDSVSINN